MKVLLWIPLTAAAPGPSILEIGLTDIHFISTVAPAMPDMKSFFLSHIRQNRQHPKASAHPVFQRRLLPTAAAAGISCDQPPFRCLDHIPQSHLQSQSGFPSLALFPDFRRTVSFPNRRPIRSFPMTFGGCSQPQL